MANSDIDVVIARSKAVLDGDKVPARSQHFKTYALSNFRGGIGKSTLAFNLAFELSKDKRCLFLDCCSQGNLSQTLFGDAYSDFSTTIYDALVSNLTSSGPVDMDDLAMPVKGYCKSFAASKPSFMVPSSSRLFLFPSLLYSQLAQYAQLDAKYQKKASARVLLSIKEIVDALTKKTSAEKILIDTSPFFGGATHLAWCAVDALIIPVRVDQHSLEALRLTLEMLKNPTMDFHKFNTQAGLTHAPKVHAVVMTHCGWNRQRANEPDNSTRFFVQKALEIAHQYQGLFSEKNVTDCFYLSDDFHSSGRISGNQRIPLSKLVSGTKYMVDGQRLEVNPSVDRYKKEIYSLTCAL
jgi:chromosome partitioning protein